MTGLLGRWARRLMGPAGRCLLLALAVAAAWLAWLVLPPRPLREWASASREPDKWLLTPDRAGLACVARRQQGDTITYLPVRVWDLATGRERSASGVPGTRQARPGASWLPQQLQPEHLLWFVTPRAGPDTPWLLTTRPTARNEINLQIWDANTGHERWSTTIFRSFRGELPANPVVSPDGRYVACRRVNQTSDVLIAATGRSAFTLGDVEPLAFSPDGATLVTVSPVDNQPATVTLWDTATGRPSGRVPTKQQDPAAAAFSPDGRRLALGLLVSSAGPDPELVELWDWRTGERVAELPISPFWDPSLTGLEFQPHGSLLTVTSIGCRQRAWDVAQSPPRAIDISGILSAAEHRGWTRYQGAVEPAYPMFSPDGSQFVGPAPEGDMLAIRESAAPDRAVIARQSAQPIDWPDFAPDGRSLAVLHWADPVLEFWQQAANWLSEKAGRPPPYTAEAHSELVVFDAMTGAAIGQVGGRDCAHLIGFGPTGHTVWTMTPIWTSEDDDGDSTLRVQEWAVPTGRPPVWLLAVTAIGLLLAVADWRRTRRRMATVPGGPTP